MTLTTHAAIGILVTQWTNNPFLGFCVGVLSHYLADAIPHGDEWAYWRHVHNPKDIVAFTIATFDTTALVLLVITVLNHHPEFNPLFIGAVVLGAIGPDLLITLHTRSRNAFKEYYTGVYQKMISYYHLFLKKHYTVHMAFHNIMHTPIRFRTAIAYQLVFLTVFFRSFVF